MASSNKKANNIKVFIRERPLSKQELEQKHSYVVQNSSLRELTLKCKSSERKYTFEHIFSKNATQLGVYNSVAAPSITNVINGCNCTILACGQSGTGKTHTIFGNPSNNFHVEEDGGLVPKIASNLFSTLNKLDVKIKYSVQISFSEVFNEEVRDLFGEGQHLRLYDDPLNKGSVYVKDLSKIIVFNPGEVLHWLRIGFAQRQSAATNYNVHKSRSHALFTFFVNTRETSNGVNIDKTGQLLLVDLAGSEFAEAATRDTASINRSISTFNKVIRALSHKIQHVPYRDSKLTRILQESLGGATKTCLIATFSPSHDAWEETLSTLELATLTKNITNRPAVRINKKQVDVVQEMEMELEMLRKELAATRGEHGFYISADTYSKMIQDTENNTNTIVDQIRKVRERENHLQALELERRNLNRSFDETKEFLSEVERQVAVNEKLVEKGESYLEHLEKQRADLNSTIQELAQVCHQATHTENIYYSKYQNSCNTKAANAQISQKLGDVAYESVERILNDSKKYLQDHLQQTKELQDGNNSIKKDVTISINQITTLAEDVENQKKDLILDEAINCFETSSQFVAEQYEKNRKEMEAFDGLTALLKATKEDSTCKIEEIEAKQSSCVETATKFIVEKENVIKILQEMSEKCKMEQENVMEEIKTNEVVIDSMTAELKKLEDRERYLDAQIAEMEENKRQLRQLATEDDVEQLQNLQESISDSYLQTNQVMTNLISASNRALELTSQIMTSVNNEASSSCRELDRSCTELFEIVGQNLLRSETRSFLQNLKGRVDDQKEASIKIAADCEKNLQYLERLENLNRDLDSKVDQNVVHALQQFDSIESKGIRVGHAGDTPAKQNYQYSKTVAEVTPLRNIFEDLLSE